MGPEKLQENEGSRGRRARWGHCGACGGHHPRTCIECGAEISCYSLVDVLVDCGRRGAAALPARVMRYERPCCDRCEAPCGFADWV
jgi:hypothetical protein